MDGNKGFATGAGRERNGARPLAELQVTHQGRRLLFGAGGAAEQKGINGGGAATAGPSRATRISSPPRTAPHARRTKSESQSASPASSASSAASRIPRPGSAASSMSQRRPRLTLVESFRLAEQEEMDALQVHEMNGSPSPAPRAYGGRQGSSDEGERLPELVPGIQDMPVSSPDARGGGRRSPERGVVGGLSPYRGMGSRYSPAKSVADRYSPRKPAPYETPPEKSFAWNVDADFTARDLQVSSSPRIKVGSNRPFANRPSLVASATAPKSNSPSRLGQQNNKLAEIRAREIALKENEAPAGLSQPRATMSVLEELRAREMSVAGLDGSQRRKNTKLDEIRRLENMGLSRKEYAAARLEEIAEKNAMARSLSPDIQASPPKLKTVQEEQVGQQDMYGVDKSVGEPIPHTPVTVYKNYRGEAHRETRAAGARPGLAGKRSDSQEVLRRLARATSFSPPTQGDKQSPRKVMQQSDANDRVENGVAAWRLGARIGTDVNKRPSALASTKNSSSSNSNKENDGPKASVAFTGLRRTESIESTCSKRSDMDAVARIEAEMKLFAPHDTHSERGSVRAPSPATTLTNDDEAANEATPRAARPDFASMPTPRVTGAYVETPLTARRGRRAAQDSADYETTSDPGTEEAKDDAAGVRASLRDAAAPRRRQRSRSVPRQQKRGVVQNSAQPISVRQDMQDMRRLYNIEDSTVDDVDEVLRGLRGGQTKQRQEEMLDGASEGEGEGEGEALYTRMARSLRSIRFAKRGIERLEDEYSRARDVDSTKMKSSDSDDEAQAKSSISRSNGLDRDIKAKSNDLDRDIKAKSNDLDRKMQAKSNDLDTDIKAKHNDLDRDIKAKSNHLDRKIKATSNDKISSSTRHPTKWRLPSLLTALLSMLVIWFAAESTTCSVYCRPRACGPATPRCEYTPASPLYFGTALPIKLDEWLLSGRARPAFTASLDAAADWLADVEDALRGRHLGDLSMEGLSPAQRRRLRRRRRARGLGWEPVREEDAEPAEREKWVAWREQRLARERVREAREAGYLVDDMITGQDTRVW